MPASMSSAGASVLPQGLQGRRLPMACGPCPGRPLDLRLGEEAGDVETQDPGRGLQNPRGPCCCPLRRGDEGHGPSEGPCLWGKPGSVLSVCETQLMSSAWELCPFWPRAQAQRSLPPPGSDIPTPSGRIPAVMTAAAHRKPRAGRLKASQARRLQDLAIFPPGLSSLETASAFTQLTTASCP